jgi:hypothetical protein
MGGKQTLVDRSAAAFPSSRDYHPESGASDKGEGSCAVTNITKRICEVAPIILIDTTHGFISHRYVIRMSNEGGGWTIYYEEGANVRAAEATEDKVAAFMKTIGAQHILE